MKKLIGVMAVLGVLAWAVARTPANEAAPPPPKPDRAPSAVPFVIVVEDGAKEPRLEIPRQVLSTLRASGDGNEGDTRRAEGLPRLHTIIGGLALALSLTLGGLWLVRSRRRFTGTGPALLLAAIAIATVGGTLLANLPPPVEPKPTTPGVPLADQVAVQVVDHGDAIRLVGSQKQLGGLMEKGQAGKGTQPAPGEKR
jgi:hypothetical protein